ncbi:MAG: succinate dehydrogenase iron-sulfur subunit [Acidimicrobiales bacterium]
MQVALEVLRFDPETGGRSRWERFRLEAEPSDRVLDLLHRVRDTHDATLAFRRSCGHGVCGSDAMMINGTNRLACTTLVGSLGRRIRVEPLRDLAVRRDLVVDMAPFFAAYKAQKPWLQPVRPPEAPGAGDGAHVAARPEGSPDGQDPMREGLQSPAEVARIDDTARCILCAACTTSCPVVWAGGQDYVGPAAVVAAHRFIFDSRDGATRQRLERLDDASGVWACRNAFNCTEACPRGIAVTSAIAAVRRATLAGDGLTDAEVQG